MDWEQANGDREPRMQGPIQNLPRHGPAVADGATTMVRVAIRAETQYANGHC